MISSRPTAIIAVKRSLRSSVTPLAALVALALAAGPSRAANFTVTSTADTETEGTLRWAILQADALTGADLIDFAIPEGACSAAGVCAILVDSNLPAITEAVVVDGTTQPRYGTAPANVCATLDAPSSMRVEVTATGAYRLFDVQGAEPSTIRGLSIGSSTPTTGVFVSSAASDNRIQCNHFGINGEGDAAPDPLSYGVCIHCESPFQAGSAIVGTDGDGVGDLGERNVFGGGGFGVYKNVGGGNRISGNYFGVGADGIIPLPMGYECVAIRQAGDNLVGSDFDGVSDHLEPNLITNCQLSGVFVQAIGGTGNVVAGNWIGVDAEGAPGSVPPQSGIELDGSPQITILRNRIEGTTDAVFVDSDGSVAAGSTGNCIRGNTSGATHSSTGDVDLTGNWWGDASGPSGDGAGSGDPVADTGSGTLFYESWLTSEPASCLSPRIFVDTFEGGDVCVWSSASGSGDDCTPPPTPLDCPCLGTAANTVGDLWSYGCKVYEDDTEFTFDAIFDILTTGVGDGRCALAIRKGDGVAFCMQGGNGGWGGDGTAVAAASPELAACRDFLINFPCSSGDTALSCAQSLDGV
jgi:hypothetical protein